jgi:hypothetical protein
VVAVSLVIMPLPACARATNFTCVCGAGDTGINNDWPALTSTFLMIADTNPVVSTFFLSYDDLGESFRLFGISLPEYWRRNGATFQNLLSSAVASYKTQLQLVYSFDYTVGENLQRVGGDDFSAIAALRLL